MVALAFLAGCRPAGREVVVYTSQDQVYAEPVLHEFTRQTGIAVRAVFDSEAVKTVGLVNRLLAERQHPQCDVFWNNEELRTRQLAAAGVLDEVAGWQAVGYRSRRLVVNTNVLPLARAPRSLAELVQPAWRGKVALAYPLFGTTATHFLALREAWGPSKWEAWCRALQGNQPLLVDGNSVAAKLVARGEAWVGLTDSDDLAAEQQEGGPLASLPLDEDSLLIRNTVAIVSRAPHRDEARLLADYLRTGAVAARLVAAHALEGATEQEVKVRTLEPDWTRLLAGLSGGTETLKRVFLR